MTVRWTPRWTERFFAEYRRKKHPTFAMSKDKLFFDMLIQTRWGRPRVR